MFSVGGYRMWLSNNVVVNMYLVERNIQNIRSKCSHIKDE